MNLNRVNKKLNEAKFFLDKLKKQETKGGKYPERFDSYLSAFLTAAKSVDELFLYEVNREAPGQRSTYSIWHREWKVRCNLADTERRLIEFMERDRNIEVHTSGSRRAFKTTMKRLPMDWGNFSQKPGVKNYVSYHWKGTKIRERIIGEPKSVKILKEKYYFTIDGSEHSVIQASTKYVKLRARMLKQFGADYPQTVALYDDC